MQAMFMAYSVKQASHDDFGLQVKATSDGPTSPGLMWPLSRTRQEHGVSRVELRKGMGCFALLRSIFGRVVVQLFQKHRCSLIATEALSTCWLGISTWCSTKIFASIFPVLDIQNRGLNVEVWLDIQNWGLNEWWCHDV